MFTLVRMARIFFLGTFCCIAGLADIHPTSRSAAAAEPNGGKASDTQLAPENKSGDHARPQFAMLTPDIHLHRELPKTEPFDLPATIVPTGEMSAKWRELQSRIFDDEKTLASCRSDESTCSQAARRFLSIVELGRNHAGRARLGWLNRAVNMSIKPRSDLVQYDDADYWASPLETLGSGAGDCEDYAIVKYVALRELGVGTDDLRLVIAQDDKRRIEHAVVAVRYEQQWLILDNRTMAILNTKDAHTFRPLFALNSTRALAVAEDR
jgi:predicted transglutaminase-like cysteine proteinase